MDIEAILKELDVEHGNAQESNQSKHKCHIKQDFKSSTLVCSHVATKIYDSISERN